MKWQDIKGEYPYLYETHLHTSEGSLCGRGTGEEMAVTAKECGYTGIIVTDHNWGGNACVDINTLTWEKWIDEYCRGYHEAKKKGDEIGLQVFWGMEAGFDGTEFLIYGVSPEWFKAHPEIRTAGIKELYELVHNAGGLFIHAHPFREEAYIPEVRLFPELVDGVEAVNATHSNVRSIGHNDPAYDARAIEYARKHKLPMTAGSDIHSTRFLCGGMAFKHKLETIQGFVKAILDGEDYILTNGDNCYTKYGELM